MEEMIMQSAMAELDLWKIFAESRQANSWVTFKQLGWCLVAARFSAVFNGQKCKFISKNNYALLLL